MFLYKMESSLSFDKIEPGAWWWWFFDSVSKIFILGTCHYLAGGGGGEGPLFWGGHNFFPSCLGEGRKFFSRFFGGGS